MRTLLVAVRGYRCGLVPTVVYRRSYRDAELPLNGPVAIRVPANAPPVGNAPSRVPVPAAVLLGAAGLLAGVLGRRRTPIMPSG